MLKILIATSRPETLRSFAESLKSDPQVRVDFAASGAEAVESVRKNASHLVVVDAVLPDQEPLKLVAGLLMVNAMVNAAVVSSMAEDEFHEASEGLGVLGRLPDPPSSADAPKLLAKLKSVLGLPAS